MALASAKVAVTPSKVTSIVSPTSHCFGPQPDGLAESTPKKQLIEIVPQ